VSTGDGEEEEEEKDEDACRVKGQNAKHYSTRTWRGRCRKSPSFPFLAANKAQFFFGLGRFVKSIGKIPDPGPVGVHAIATTHVRWRSAREVQ